MFFWPIPFGVLCPVLATPVQKGQWKIGANSEEAAKLVMDMETNICGEALKSIGMFSLQEKMTEGR